MQEALKDLEAQLDKLLGTGSPYQMSDKSRRALASAGWAIVLIMGIVQAWSAITLWQLGHVLVNEYVPGAPYNGVGVQGLGLFFYLSFLIVLIDAALLLLATPQLKDFHRRGWNLVYYALLLNLVYSFVRIFSTVGGGFGQFIVSLFFAAVLGYFLFQTRSLFTEGKVKVAVPPAKQAGKVIEEKKPHETKHTN